MIFVTVGTHPQDFSRLLAKIDELVEKQKITEDVFAQTGYSTYTPKHYAHEKFLGLDEFEAKIRDARLAITHGGEGNIGTALQHGKPLVIVPRLARFNEHTNDHQTELADAIARTGQGTVVYDIEQLEHAIQKAARATTGSAKRPEKMIHMLDAFVTRQFGAPE